MVEQNQPVTGTEVVGSCNIETLDKLKETHKGGMFILISQKGCQDCETMKEVLAETVKDKKPVIEAPLEDGQCVTLAKELGTSVTPSIIYYEGGQEKARVLPDGKSTWDDMRKRLRELADARPASSPMPA